MLQRLKVLIKKVLGQFSQVCTISHFCSGYITGFIKVAVFIEYFMHLILNFRLQIQFFHHFWNHFTYLLRLRNTGLRYLLFYSFFDRPKSVGVFDFFENELTLLRIIKLNVCALFESCHLIKC